MSARDAFSSQPEIDGLWQGLNFTGPPDFELAVEEHEQLVETLHGFGIETVFLPHADEGTLDAIYVRDASVATDRGIILCSMGKPARRAEPAAQGAQFRAWGIPILGEIGGLGRLEGGDVAWLDERTVAVGRGYRTNDEGIRQFRALLSDAIDDLIVVPLPHWRGPHDVFHLMSIFSPLDRDLALVYSPLIPVSFREALLERGFGLVEVADEEFETMAANALAVAPRQCLLVEGNPRTRARLEEAGVQVTEYRGGEISLKGGGGPTCLTRPLERLR
ncbi:MAG: hypothetical protein IIC36_09415 [Gemmatimonadetes bacterium]|nr:hypothetical protein [Gemmatimonadota bacterium]